MTYRLEFTINQLPPMNSADGTNRWVRRKLRKTWELLVWEKVRLKKPPAPLRSATVSLVRHSSVEPDYDNLVQGGKFIIDSLVDNGIFVSDKMSVIGKPNHDWKMAAPRKGRVDVVVESIDDGSGSNGI